MTFLTKKKKRTKLKLMKNHKVTSTKEMIKWTITTLMKTKDHNKMVKLEMWKKRKSAKRMNLRSSVVF